MTEDSSFWDDCNRSGGSQTLWTVLPSKLLELFSLMTEITINLRSMPN